MKQPIAHPDKRFVHGIFSAGVRCDGWLYVSGHGPLDMTTGQLVPGTIEEQTALTLQHIEKVLHQAGCSRADIVRCTCYLADLDDFAGFNRAYGEFFHSPLAPARTTVQAGLMKRMKVEIDAVARVPA